MRKIVVFFALLQISTVNAQTKNFIDQPYIEVAGAAAKMC